VLVFESLNFTILIRLEMQTPKTLSLTEHSHSCYSYLCAYVHFVEMDPTFFNNRDNVDKIIELYEVNSVLWDCNLATYHDRNKILAAKTAIMEALKLSSRM
jgi:hypothetical protein